MNFLEAKQIAQRMVDIANEIRDNRGSRDLFDEMALLYGRLRPVILEFLPQQQIQVRGNWNTISEHPNYIEAGFMTGKGVYEIQGRAQLLQVLGMLEERAAENETEQAIFGSPPIVNEARLQEIRSLDSSQFDFSRLIRLCEELNASFENSCYHATAAMTRAILDHVAPVFGLKSFSEVANNHGPKSFKEAMQHLDKTAKKIADGHLHIQIRSTESLPNATQVNFAPELDVLLAEVSRFTREGA